MHLHWCYIHKLPLFSGNASLISSMQIWQHVTFFRGMGYNYQNKALTYQVHLSKFFTQNMKLFNSTYILKNDWKHVLERMMPWTPNQLFSPMEKIWFSQDTNLNLSNCFYQSWYFWIIDQAKLSFFHPSVCSAKEWKFWSILLIVISLKCFHACNET